MPVLLIRDPTQLETVRPAWQRMVSHPLMSPAWLLTWWEHYGATENAGLFVLAVLDDQHELIGLAPWYLKQNSVLGNTIHAMGNGAACTDHVSLLYRPGRMHEVTQAISHWFLSDTAIGRARLLHLDSVDENDEAIRNLTMQCDQQGAWIEHRPGPDTWQVALPDSWDAYLASLSRNHRKRCRRWDRQCFQNGRVQTHAATSMAELEQGMSVLRELHSSRRESLGDAGAFSNDRFQDFHADVMRRMLASQSLRLAWLTLDERPVAIEYQLVSSDCVFAYQSGMDSTASDISPGSLSLMSSIRWAIENGKQRFDFMRGDEPYKCSWGASPHPTYHLRIRPDLIGTAVRHGVSRAGFQTRSWFKQLKKG